MVRYLRTSVMVLAVLLGVSGQAWSAPAENLMPPSYYVGDPRTNSAYFEMEDAKVSFDKNKRTFTAAGRDVTLYDPNHREVKLKSEYFGLVAKTDADGTTATGKFVFGSGGGGGGYGIGSGVLFQGSITDVGWSNSTGFLEFTITNFSGKLCDLGWCSIAERLWFDTSGSLGIVDGNGNYQSFSKKMDGIAIVPVPAAVWLLGSGLIGLAGIARRKKAALV